MIHSPCARNALVVVGTIDGQNGDSRAHVYQNEREWLREIELPLLTFPAKIKGQQFYYL